MPTEPGGVQQPCPEGVQGPAPNNAGFSTGRPWACAASVASRCMTLLRVPARISLLMETVAFTVSGGQRVSQASASGVYHILCRKVEEPAVLVVEGAFCLRIRFTGVSSLLACLLHPRPSSLTGQTQSSTFPSP